MLVEALMVAANDNRVAQYGDGYVDADLLDWAKQQLGVGDYEGLIDDYIASPSRVDLAAHVATSRWLAIHIAVSRDGADHHALGRANDARSDCTAIW